MGESTFDQLQLELAQSSKSFDFCIDSNGSVSQASEPVTPQESFSLLQTPLYGLDCNLISQIQQQLIYGGSDKGSLQCDDLLKLFDIKREESQYPSPSTPSLLPPSPLENEGSSSKLFDLPTSFDFDFSELNQDVAMEDLSSSSKKAQKRKAVEEPIKSRSYQVKSSTSKKNLPGFAIPLLIQEFQKAQESGDKAAVDELSALLSTSNGSNKKSKLSISDETESALVRLESEIEKKRKNNTLSARKSRAKKVELEKTLEIRKKELEKEIEGLKRRCRMAERDLEWRKRTGPA